MGVDVLLTRSAKNFVKKIPWEKEMLHMENELQIDYGEKLIGVLKESVRYGKKILGDT